MQILAEMTMSIRLTARQANDHHKAIERLASTLILFGLTLKVTRCVGKDSVGRPCDDGLLLEMTANNEAAVDVMILFARRFWGSAWPADYLDEEFLK